MDDDEAFRRSLGRLLSSREHEVTLASSGAEALEIIQPDLFDLIILDLWMPGMNGIQTLEQLRKIDPWAPVITVSARGTDITINTCLKAGATAFLPKPFTAEDIDELVREVGAAGRVEKDAVVAGERKGWRCRLLVADDHDGFRTAVVRRLRLEGFDVTEAKTGRQAADLSAETQFDALLLDIHMPEANGIEAGELVRHRDPNLPIVFMSGEANDAEMREGLKYSSAGCLKKPLDIDKLGQLLSFLIQAGRSSRRHEEARKAFESLPVWKRLTLRGARRLQKIRQSHETPRIILLMIVAMMIAFFVMSFLDAGQRVMMQLGKSIEDVPSPMNMYRDITGYLKRDEERELKREPEPGNRP